LLTGTAALPGAHPGNATTAMVEPEKRKARMRRAFFGEKEA